VAALPLYFPIYLLFNISRIGKFCRVGQGRIKPIKPNQSESNPRQERGCVPKTSRSTPPPGRSRQWLFENAGRVPSPAVIVRRANRYGLRPFTVNYGQLRLFTVFRPGGRGSTPDDGPERESLPGPSRQGLEFLRQWCESRPIKPNQSESRLGICAHLCHLRSRLSFLVAGRRPGPRFSTGGGLVDSLRR